MLPDDPRNQPGLVQVEDGGPIPVVRIAGDLDLETAPWVGQQLHEVSRYAPAGLVIDLSGVTFCSSAGLARLLDCQRQVGDQDGKVGLAGCSSAVHRLLDITGVRDLFSIADTMDESMTEVAPHRPEP